MNSTLTAVMAALSLALAGCVTTAATPGTAPESTPSDVEKLDMAWLAATSIAATVAVLKPDAAEDIDRGLAIAAVAVSEARVQILAAADDTSASMRALTVGLSALAIFREALVAYRAKVPPKN